MYLERGVGNRRYHQMGFANIPRRLILDTPRIPTGRRVLSQPWESAWACRICWKECKTACQIRYQWIHASVQIINTQSSSGAAYASMTHHKFPDRLAKGRIASSVLEPLVPGRCRKVGDRSPLCESLNPSSWQEFSA